MTQISDTEAIVVAIHIMRDCRAILESDLAVEARSVRGLSFETNRQKAL